LEHEPQMLERLRAGLPALVEPQVTLHAGDLRDFSIPFLFRLVVAPCNVFAQLADKELADCLQAVGRHLTAGGTLAFEVPSPSDAEYAIQASAEPLSAFTEPQTGNPVQVYAEQVAGEEEGEQFVRWRYDELQPDGTVRRHALETRFFLRPPAKIAAQLLAAKLGPPTFFGDYRGSPWTGTSPTLLVVSRRSEGL
jgi:hypothetical protein